MPLASGAAGTYHRRVPARETLLVLASGELWGKEPSVFAGGHYAGLACVKAYVGPLPAGTKGYTFTTLARPTGVRSFSGGVGVVWEEGMPGVTTLPNVPGQPTMVKITVTVLGHST